MTNSGQFEEVCLCNSEIKTGWTTENGIPLCNICGKVDVKACVEMAGESWHARAELPKAPEGMALVPLDALSRIMELAGVALVYQPFGTKDRQHFDALIAATKEKGE